jgi:hypothetical protein
MLQVDSFVTIYLAEAREISLGGDNPFYQQVGDIIIGVAQDLFIDVSIVLSQAGTSLDQSAHGVLNA